MAQQKPVEIVRTMCEEVYGKGRTELIRDMVTDDYLEHDPLMGTHDARGIERVVQTYHRAFPDMTLEVLACVQGGDIVTARWRTSGTHEGELMGIAPTNKRATIEGITMVRFANGKAQEAWAQWDALGLLRAIGAVPEMKAARPDGGARAGAPRR
jgi:predicted ester cyclase